MTEQRARLLQIAEMCPVHRTLDRGADVTTTITPPSGRTAAPTSAVPPEHMRDMETASES